MRITFALIFAILLSFSLPSANTQTLDDALRLSTLEHTGTARYMGVGGAMTALGADYSSSAYNPAGLAMIRRGELVFTPVLFVNNTDSRWNANRENDRFSNLQFSNFGLVIAGEPGGSSSFTNFAFSVGFNRLASFHSHLYARTRNEGSILDRFVALGDGLAPSQIDDFEVGLAYDVFALIYDEATNSYFTDLDPGTVLQKEFDQRIKGSINEIFLSLAGNLRERLIMGITLSVPIVSYTEDKFYKDRDDENVNPIYRSFEFTETAEVTGAGFQIKAGMIYRHSQALRFGFAIHSPGWYSLSDEYTTSATFDYDFTQIPGEITPGPQTANSPQGLFDYNFTSPWRVLAGTGYLFENRGFLSFDVEYLDYTSAQFNFTRRNSSQFLEDERNKNNEIRNNLSTALNFRLGGEVAIQTLRLRGGLQFIQNPFEDVSDRDLTWSLGVGIRESSFFLDLAFQRSIREGAINPYVVPDQQEQQRILSDAAINRIAVTAGFKF